MARKNSNAGQPNREAQKTRRVGRMYLNNKFRPVREVEVMGPGSEGISPQKSPSEVKTTTIFTVREKVAA